MRRCSGRVSALWGDAVCVCGHCKSRGGLTLATVFGAPAGEELNLWNAEARVMPLAWPQWIRLEAQHANQQPDSVREVRARFELSAGVTVFAFEPC